MRNFARNLIISTLLSVGACSVGGQYGTDTSGFDYYGHGHALTGASATAPSLTIPFAPWPPPEPSARLVLSSHYFSDRGRFRSLGDVGDYWTTLLSSAGYTRFGYYLAPGGFAIVTPLESIDAVGRPLAGDARWIPEPPPMDSNPLKSWFLALWNKPTGHYRVLIIFVTTDVSPPDPNQSVDQTTISKWVTNGMPDLPSEIRDSSMTNRHICYINFYEIEKEEGESPRLLDGVIDPMSQLQRTGIVLAKKAI